MNIGKIILRPKRKLLLGGTITLVAVLLTISVASATLVSINTNDNTAADWSGVPLFVSDSNGDLNTSCSGAASTDDIIETYVASGPSGGGSPSYIYFLVKFASTNVGFVPAQYHQVSAFMDCAPAGQDNLDANVIYRGYPDQVALCNGVSPNPDCFLYSSSGTEGQRPLNGTSNYTLEWRGSFGDMATFTAPGPLNCTNNNIATIKFTSYRVTNFGTYSCTYDETSTRAFNSPTAVDMVSMQASNQADDPFLVISLVAASAAILAGAVGYSLLQNKSV